MSLVLLKKDGHVATITLNDSERLNAMSVAMGFEFKECLEELRLDKNIRVVILTGSGRAFSSGGNLDMLEQKFSKSESENEKGLKDFYKTFLAIRDLNQPVIAAINGHAVGAGFCLSLACDLRYVSDKAKMGANFAKIGLAPGMGGTYFITQLLGPTKASEILLTGKIFTATEAKDMGLINDVIPHDSLLKYVQDTAIDIANNGPLAISYIKKGIQKAQNSSLEDMFDYDSQAQAACFTSEDIKEGIASVREKRAAKFLGK